MSAQIDSCTSRPEQHVLATELSSAVTPMPQPSAYGLAGMFTGYPFAFPQEPREYASERSDDFGCVRSPHGVYLDASAAGSVAKGALPGKRELTRHRGPSSSTRSTGAPLAPELKLFFRILECWKLDRRVCASLLDLPRESIVDLLEQGYLGLEGRDRLDRVANVIAIYMDLHQLLRSDDTERDWLHEYRDELGKRPIDLLLSGRLEDLIDLRRYIEFLAGR